ncbi:MAG: hypothetical protein C5B57_12195 [Blastocatellia bacterium]|nr:MAG: hypothetical protein C5B57_12195 [Blastocatellia bacterium]
MSNNTIASDDMVLAPRPRIQPGRDQPAVHEDRVGRPGRRIGGVSCSDRGTLDGSRFRSGTVATPHRRRRQWGAAMRDHTEHVNEFDRGLILSLQNNLLDAEIVVDAYRHELDAAVVPFQQAVQRRDMLARQLAALVEVRA